ncbi:hypothetical protein SAMN05518865_113188 [Duganella sp. CF458]|uniref:hypothetical protein n=1 Tax=Duganella sp. CF458 TaxID=1884368 RepID=UPI0008ECF970|nr:hypothetical protein [Duganella sp. CF458]SFG54313.1 hypothetical protein SAMN05518865_113188 [Duganella sp. CF458]
MKILSLKCVNCGAGLEVKEDINDFACGYCGVQQHVERSGGIVSLRRLEEALDDVKLGTNRAASELALTRLQADVAAICARRDSQVGALRAADARNSALVGWAIIAFAIFAIVMYGWWSIPIIVGGFIFGSQFLVPVTKRVKAIEANAAAQIEPLKTQIARHQSIVDSYDFGTAANS